MRFVPCARASSAASAAMRMKMPVVSGQVTSAPYSAASFFRIVPTVISLPLGTLRMRESINFGVGISIMPLPKRDILGNGNQYGLLRSFHFLPPGDSTHEFLFHLTTPVKAFLPFRRLLSKPQAC